MSEINEVREKKHKYPFTVYRTSRGNYRAILPGGKERSFKLHSEALAWIDAYREKKNILQRLETQQITPRTEIRRTVSYIRQVLEKSKEMKVNLRLELRKVMGALTKIHTRMTD